MAPDSPPHLKSKIAKKTHTPAQIKVQKNIALKALSDLKSSGIMVRKYIIRYSNQRRI